MKQLGQQLRFSRAALLLPVLLLLAPPATVQAQFQFTTNNDGSFNIYKYVGSGGAVIIPGTNNGYPVSSIGDYAFYFCSNLTSVTIPNSVMKIGAVAFGVCNSLTNVMIPNSVTNIGDYAFIYCTSLTSVTIPNSVTSIGDDTFGACRNLTAITVDALNSLYCSVEGVLFDKSRTILIEYPGGKAGSYTISNNVTSIKDEAFYACRLTSVTIPNSVTNIGDEAFESCTNLTNVTIGDSVTTIGDYAFADCISLTNVMIPNSVTYIGNAAFEGCTNLTNITIGNGVTSIGGSAFYGCTNLTSVMIPKSVTSIGFAVFGFCASLTAIIVDTNDAYYSSLNGVLFDKSQTTLVEYPAGTIGSYTIPNSVTSVRSWAFCGCHGLTNVTIGNNVTSIGSDGFFGCDALTKVVVGNSVTTFGYSVFEFCTGLTNLYFQGNAPSLGVYPFSYLGNNATIYFLPGTTGWSELLSAFGVRSALWTLPYPLILNNGSALGVQADGFGFTISWATNIPVVVEACTNLANPVWNPVVTNTLNSGTNYFSDSQWTNYPSRFYRVRAP